MAYMPATRLVIKCGTEVLYGKGGWMVSKPKEDRWSSIARQVVAAEEMSGVSMILVSSGAVRAGQENFKGTSSIFQLGKREQWAGIGTRHLLKHWGDAFGCFGREIAYLLVSRATLRDSGERQAIFSAIADYHRCCIVPILNENDVALEGEGGGNDLLAADIACLTGASGVLFLTECGGVYEIDPWRHPGVRRYSEIDPRTALTSSWLEDGMAGKLLEVVRCFAMGMRTAVAGLERDSIQRFAAGEPVGTMIGNSVSFY